MTQIGKNIKKRRKMLGMTQMQLADKVGISQAHLCNTETGKYSMSLNFLNKVATALDSSIADLLKTEEEEK